MADYEQTTKTNPRRPDCVTKIRMGNSVLVVSGYFKTAPKLPSTKWKKCCKPKPLLHRSRLIRHEPGAWKKRPCFDMAAFALG